MKHDNPDGAERFRASARTAWDEYLKPVKLHGRCEPAPEAWFLGAKGENKDLLLELVHLAIDSHCDARNDFHPDDPSYLTDKERASPQYRNATAAMRREAGALFELLQKSAPVYSLRHQGHMLWDQALPATVGYFGAMLYNQNNVAAEASPVTTVLEIQVGNDLCRMLGLSESQQPGQEPITPWGHITCDGSVANIESLWAARNAKFFAVALRAALREDTRLAAARHVQVKLLNGEHAQLVDLSTWTLLNLALDEVVALPRALERYGIEPAILTEAMRAFSLQSVGMVEFTSRFLDDVPEGPIAIVPATRHYSWPKGAALLGLGQKNIRTVRVDDQARMDIDDLRAILERCFESHVPVISVVAVIGSTEESAVDPLEQILELRETYRKKGLDFAIHCDAAWGGYFNSMLIDDDDGPVPVDAVPDFPMSEYVQRQYRALRRADSITVDPHKAGYIPYAAGALCYRNSATRDLVSLRSPVVFHSQSEPTVGVYGIEGSKPGAAAAAVYLAHKVIRPTKSGYGRLLGQCIWTSKRLYSRLVTLDDARFKLVPFQMLPAEKRNASQREIAEELDFIREHFVGGSANDVLALLHASPQARKVFEDLGSDQVILAFALNFYVSPGVLNTDVQALNAFNNKIFELCSVTRPPRDLNELNEVGLILTSSAFDPFDYGHRLVARFGHRLGISDTGDSPVAFLISTSMNPWTSDPDAGNFLEVFVEELSKAAHRALDELGLPAIQNGAMPQASPVATPQKKKDTMTQYDSPQHTPQQARPSGRTDCGCGCSNCNCGATAHTESHEQVRAAGAPIQVPGLAGHRAEPWASRSADQRTRANGNGNATHNGHERAARGRENNGGGGMPHAGHAGSEHQAGSGETDHTGHGVGTRHAWVMLGHETLFICHLPMFHHAEHAYQCVLRVSLSDKALQAYRTLRRQYPRSTFFIANVEGDPMTLPELKIGKRKSFVAEVFRDIPEISAPEYKTWPWEGQQVAIQDFAVTVEQVVLYRHYDANAQPNRTLGYYLFGAGEEAHMTNQQFRAPGFDHVVSLTHAPGWLPEEELAAGVQVSVPGLAKDYYCECESPLARGQHRVQYFGSGPEQPISVETEHWFSTKIINETNPCLPHQGMRVSEYRE